MPVPKRRTFKSRLKSRKAHDKVRNVALSECPRCGAAKMPHRACNSCGYYKARKVVEV